MGNLHCEAHLKGGKGKLNIDTSFVVETGISGVVIVFRKELSGWGGVILSS
jgi:hypothetical protein